MADLLLQGSSKLIANGCDHVESPPMFRTGLGKSVSLKQSSLLKALSILGDECNAISASGLLGGEANGGWGSFSNSMFQTGLGKAVNISTAGLVRAKSLLGFEDNHDNETFQGFEPKTKDSKDSEHFGWQSSCRLEMTKDSPSFPVSPFDLKCGSVGCDSKETTPHYVHSASRQPLIKFHSAGGRSISVSSDALRRARSLLGDPELGAFLDGGDAGNPSFSSYKESISDYSSVDKDNEPSIPLPDQGTAKNKHMPNNFVSPLRPIFYQKQSVARSESRGLGSKVGAPLAFRCIKSVGGAVPSTLVGITRIYPILYRERLSDGGFVVRSERMESKMIQVYNQRGHCVGIGIKRTYRNNEQDSDEGAKILKILETAAEPEVLMAEMSSEQLNSFSTYQAKLESMRQADVQKSIEKALEDAGLSGREVTPFMRVRVVGLNNKSYSERCRPREGLITIWNPTEKQIPFICKQEDLLLNGCLCRRQKAPFVSPRKPVLLSNIGEVLNSSEFDIAGFVIYVGEVYTAAHQKKQWVFVTDGSLTELHLEETNPLLAISFCSPCVDCDSVLPINYNLAGSAVSTESVGFCNLIKRKKDQMNHLWVAEATENSNYFLNYDHAHISHLKDAASSAQRCAMTSSLVDGQRDAELELDGYCHAVEIWGRGPERVLKVLMEGLRGDGGRETVHGDSG
ncbi:hypothetical protein RJ639_037043 [Escallonia herrerae]|uniref:Uncharacterized protein n=1 Tax=Escallonia herrerae TaxID=1293975 RepID=A0AA89BIE2_9ASTE|nr:hypothetical protein RJ639_037043 [Escallonia herrerae]